MAELFDDISRIVGSNMPRRRALTLIMGAVAGSGVAALWPTRAGAVKTHSLECNKEVSVLKTGSASAAECAALKQSGEDDWNKKVKEARDDAEKKVNEWADEQTCSPNCPLLERMGIVNTGPCNCNDANNAVECKVLAIYRCCKICPGEGKCCAFALICCGQRHCCAQSDCIDGRCPDDNPG